MDLPVRRSQLAPGLRVVRRGLDQLQVGLHDGRRVVLPRTEVVERTLSLLLERRPVEESPATSLVLDRLARHGCLVPEQQSPGPVGTVAVLGPLDLGPLDGPALRDVHGLLATAGVATTPEPSAAGVVMVLSAGELPRDRLDPLLRSRTSHVVVRLVDGAAVLGPFVVPGATACLRCIDAHETVRDPDHVAVTSRYVDATSRPRADGVPDTDPALVSAALAWAVRDVVAHLGGREPSTWSRTLVLGPEPAADRGQTWLRHPRCGCCWDASG